MLLSGPWTHSNKRCRNSVLYIEVVPTIHQAIGVYMHYGNPRNGIGISGTRIRTSDSTIR